MNIFVIMPFKDEYTALYEEIIERACRDRKLKVLRADKILESGNIPQQILQSIRDALFIIAEVSEDNPNVFYELGYAHSSNKPIIAIADRARKLPFDISGERTIFYDRSKQGWENKLRSALGDVIDHQFDVSNRLQVSGMVSEAKLLGHYHEVTGRIFSLECGEHLWMFIRRDGFELWSVQNGGEIEVNRDGTWRATMYLGWAHEGAARDNWFIILFGTLNTADNRELTERCIKNRINPDVSLLRQLWQSVTENSPVRGIPTLRQLPLSFRDIYSVRVKRLN